MKFDDSSTGGELLQAPPVIKPPPNEKPPKKRLSAKREAILLGIMAMLVILGILFAPKLRNMARFALAQVPLRTNDDKRELDRKVAAVEEKLRVEFDGKLQKLAEQKSAQLTVEQPKTVPVPPPQQVTKPPAEKPVKTNPPARVVVNDLTEGKTSTPRRRQDSSAKSSRVVAESVLDPRLAALARQAGLTNRKR